MAGIRIAENKRVMVSNRVRRRLRATGINSFAEYYNFLTSPAGGDEMPLFLDAITTNETYFFRDIQQYEWLGETFLPEIVATSCPAETTESPANLVGCMQHGRRTLFDRSQASGQKTAVRRLAHSRSWALT